MKGNPREFPGVLKMFYILSRVWVKWRLNIFQNSSNYMFKICAFQGFPGGTVVKNLPANAGDMGLSPGRGRSHVPQSN